ncbi:MAG: hypothetical protein P8P52_04010 [Opitutae bacterium]|nr:hypothetical protein [Opitutae bacterium]
MDIIALKEGLTAAYTAVKTIKGVKDMLPESKEKNQISQTLETAEEQLKIAEAKVAKELGFELCDRHFPPGIMIQSEKNYYTCKDCGEGYRTGVITRGGGY